jgi:hypothetical protein
VRRTFTAAEYLTEAERKEHNDLVLRIFRLEEQMRTTKAALNHVRMLARVRKSRGERKRGVA